MRVRHLPLAVVIIVLLIAACDGTRPTPTLASLVVSCDASRLTSFGQQARCTARATLSNGQTEDRTAAAQWSSSDPSKVTVNGELATAVAVGSADITARVDATSAKQTMTVDVGCTVSVTPPSAAFGAAGGSQVVDVSASPAGCEPSTWTASSNSPGLTVSPGQGSGSGSVTVTAAPNGSQSQTRTATIAGQTFTANLNAACTVAFQPAGGDNAGPGAGDRDVAVVVTHGPCRWIASTSDHWITLSQTEGTANATVRVSYAQNTGSDRTGSVTFTGPACDPTCRSGGTTTVVIRQARPTMSTLSVALGQGAQISGPYAGVVTGPDGFSCSLGSLQQQVSCPALTVPTGTSVTLSVALTSPLGVGAQPLQSSVGCTSATRRSCTVLVNGDRSVTLRLGCEISCGPLGLAPSAPEPEQLVVGIRPSLGETDDGLRAEEAERHAVAPVAEREELARMPAVRTDVGQTVGRRREQSLPRVLRAYAAQ